MSVITDTKEILTHHGTKGMKWGVRKAYKPTGRSGSGTKKPKYTERADLGKRAKGSKTLQKQALRVVKKGDTVHHVTMNADLVPRAGGLYASYLESDAETYRTEYKTFLEATRDAKKVFEYDLKVVQDIITPSKQAKVDAFIEMHRDKNSEQLVADMAKNKMSASFGLAIARLVGLGKNQKSNLTKKYQDLIESDDPKAQQKAFDDFAQFLVWEPKIRKQYFKKLAKDGFTAMYDDFDMDDYSKEPLIIFNPEKSLAVVEKREV